MMGSSKNDQEAKKEEEKERNDLGSQEKKEIEDEGSFKEGSMKKAAAVLRILTIAAALTTVKG